MTKSFWKTVLVLTISWLVSFFIVAWLVPGGFWLHFFLACALTSAQGVLTDVREKFEYQQQRLDDADAELVRLSTQVDEQNSTIDELKDHIRELENKLEDR